MQINRVSLKGTIFPKMAYIISQLLGCLGFPPQVIIEQVLEPMEIKIRWILINLLKPKKKLFFKGT